ncbi:hypothetical protein [Absidia glauca]|uniref:Gfd2/YDR514C-like C-terminal domain-containing protein n=1 Tax=Absidia glauca TaxID=4829 RepID=A0A163JF30_ABSGL|nr:hypothetical protein [Absidia glauca]
MCLKFQRVVVNPPFFLPSFYRPMADDDYLVVWKDLESYWIQNYESNSNVSIQRFLEPPQLFSTPDGVGLGLPFVQGERIDRSTGEHHLLLHPDNAERLGELTSDYLGMNELLDIPHHLVLPGTDYIVNKAVDIQNRGHYQKLVKQASQANKRHRKLLDAQDEYRFAHTLLEAREHVFLSLDIEAYETDHSILLELGWTMYDARNDQYLDQHYMMEPYRHLRNGKYVDDQRMNFGFGTSVWATLDQALDELAKDLAWATERDGGFVLVGHGLNSDLLYLKQCNFEWPVVINRKRNGRFVLAETGVLDVHDSALVTIVNTDTLYGASINDLHNPPSLGRCLTLMDIEHWNLHNAGNDAHYTMELMMALLEKAPLVV